MRKEERIKKDKREKKMDIEIEEEKEEGERGEVKIGEVIVRDGEIIEREGKRKRELKEVKENEEIMKIRKEGEMIG